MAKSESAKECKRHPNHKSLPGVCPSCLREKLQQFHNQPSIISSHSAISTVSSANSSRRRRHHHHRNASEMLLGSTKPDLFPDNNNLKKSGSIGILAADANAHAHAHAHAPGKKKPGFWSKLLVRPKAWYFHSHPKVSSTQIVG